MKKVFFLVIFISSMCNGFSQDKKHWALVYHNDNKGKTIEGNLQDLINASRNGEEIRIYWSSQRKNNTTEKIEHFADAKFLTIMSDTIVFAQIDPIIGQTPSFEKQTVQLKENLEWCLIAASNGKSDIMMRNMITGEIVGHRQAPLGVKWYIKE